MTRTPDTPPEAAEALASIGWRVIPIGPGQKYPTGLGRWQKAATDDLHTIRAWYTTKFEGFGVGVACGPGSGIWVLDVDTHDADGFDALAALIETHGALPPTVMSVTGGGGAHIFFEWDPSRPVNNGMATSLPDGLDIRGEGGQVVLPPSIHPDGAAYEWEASPWEAPIAPAPEWLHRLLEPPASPVATPTPVIELYTGTQADLGETPAEYIARNSDWHATLNGDGWTLSHHARNQTHWTRPGKDPRDGASAVLHEPDGPFVIFSTNAPNLDAFRKAGNTTADGSGVSVSMFGYRAAMEHAGDRSALARDTRSEMTPPTVRVQLGTERVDAIEGEAESEERQKPGGFISVGDWWDGDYQIKPALVLPRLDGQGLLYHDELNWVHGDSGSGKALADDEPVLTPDGWQPIGSITRGVEVVAADGTPTEVLGVYPQGERDLYRVTFSDGVAIKADAAHLWHTQTVRERAKRKPGRARTTAEITATLHVDGGRANHYVPMVGPVQHSMRHDLPVDPYVLGVLLGDGGMSGGDVMLICPDAQIIEAVREHYELSATANPIVHRVLQAGADMRRLGLLGKRSWEKHVPIEYMHASVGQRHALLQGMLDTDGYGKGSTCEYSTSSPMLAEAAAELVRSLGGTVKTSDKIPTYTYRGVRREGRRSWRLNIKLPGDIAPFRLRRKAMAYRPRTKYQPYRQIVNVEAIGRGPATCIAVAHPSRLFVARGHVVTHNTWMLLQAAKVLVEGGTHVCWVHYEDATPATIVHRLKLLGVPREAAAQYFHYYDPIGEPLAAIEMLPELQRIGVEHLFLDSVGEALNAAGVSEDSDQEVGPWISHGPRYLVNHGIGCTVVDHSTKNTDLKLHPSGSKRKRAAVTGMSVLVEPIMAPAAGQDGLLKLLCGKDRHGNYRQGSTMAMARVVQNELRGVSIVLEDPAESTTQLPSSTNPAKPNDGVANQEQAARALVRTVVEKPGLTKLELIELKAIPSAVFAQALATCVGSGLIEAKADGEDSERYFPVDS